MIYTPLTKKALSLSFEAHKNQTDKSGLPYVFHPFHLAERMDDELSTVCALLHDVVEDTDYTFESLEDMGFPREVTDVLRLLTHEDGTAYEDYVKRLSGNTVAKKVKLSDLRHNSDLTRLNEITEKDIQRAEKYKKAIAFLENN